MKPFIYLIQGQRKLIQSYSWLRANRKDDIICLTYDEPCDGAIFYPNSTWAQGRNRLLTEARKQDEYLYYIFCDDDIEFKKGSWKKFEENLLKYRPGIAVPVFQKTFFNVIKYPKLNCQAFFVNDEQLIAFHRDVVNDNLVLPYQLQYDQVNWSATCEIQEILIQNFYPFSSIQFNNIRVRNTCKERYDAHHDNVKSYRKLVMQWLDSEFRGRYKLTSHYEPPNLHTILFRTGVFLISRAVGKRNYSTGKNRIKRKLKPGAVLTNQALSAL